MAENETSKRNDIAAGNAETSDIIETDRTASPDAETKPEGEADIRMGQTLRRTRERLGLDLDEIAKETRLRAPYLMAIERMEVHAVPSGYLNPYLRTYANRLGLHADEVIAAYREQCGGLDDVQEAATIVKLEGMETGKSYLPVYIAAGAIACLAAVAGFVFLSAPTKTAPVIASSVPVPVNGARESLFAEQSDAIKPVEGNLPLSLTAVRQGWIEVRGADGTIFRSRVMAAGETYFPRLGADWTVSARDGGAFEWRVGDIVVGTLGPDAAPVYAVNVDRAAAEAVEKISPALAANGGGTPSR